MQEAVITVWSDGTWKVWGAMDAHYAQSDPTYLLTIPIKDMLADAKMQTDLKPVE
jgi:hypothetical protein